MYIKVSICQHFRLRNCATGCCVHDEPKSSVSDAADPPLLGYYCYWWQ